MLKNEQTKGTQVNKDSITYKFASFTIITSLILYMSVIAGMLIFMFIKYKFRELDKDLQFITSMIVMSLSLVISIKIVFYLKRIKLSE